MELMDIMDKVTPISGDYKELIPPYIGSGHIGRTLPLNRNNADRGSNPLSSTQNSSGPVFCFVSDYVKSMWF